MEWADAMISLNDALEEAKNSGITKDEVLKEVDNVFIE